MFFFNTVFFFSFNIWTIRHLVAFHVPASNVCVLGLGRRDKNETRSRRGERVRRSLLAVSTVNMAEGGRVRRTIPEDLSNVEFETSEEVEVVPTFDNMGLREDLLRGIYAYGKKCCDLV